MDVDVIVVAAGNSQRMGFDKLTASLTSTRSVLEHGLVVFQEHPAVRRIVVATSPERFALLSGPKLERVAGGAKRHESVASALELLAGSAHRLVAVHDGARPLLALSDWNRVLECAARYGAAALASRVTATLKRCDEDGKICAAVSREQLWAMETPQVFASQVLYEAYAALHTRNEEPSDETSAVCALGHPVYVVPSEYPNLKITCPADLALARALVAQQNSAATKPIP